MSKAGYMGIVLDSCACYGLRLFYARGENSCIMKHGSFHVDSNYAHSMYT